jgi:histidinol phosphatase-like PHP family hydrolase
MNSWNRRSFVGTVAGAAAAYAASGDDWIDLFNGRSLDGWAAAENKDTWKVNSNGWISNDGPRSHLFYTGPGGESSPASFRNFEVEAELLAKPYCNSGLFFHTRYQEKGFPVKGFEIQVNNTALGEGTYRERKKTGSLYAVRNVYKQLVPDDEWFRIRAMVRGKNIQIWINDIQTVDYTEPQPPVIPPGSIRERYLDQGTFALQGHDGTSKSFWRKIRVRRLADDAVAPGSGPSVVDETFRKLIQLGADNYPVVDLHVHLKPGLDLAGAMARSFRDGVYYGIAANFGRGQLIQNDAGVRKFIDSLKGASAFVGMQAEGREWVKMFSKPACAGFDYIFADSMTWTDNHGKRMRLWIPEEVGVITNIQEFIDTLVERTGGMLEHEPIDVYANPTFLPQQIASDYDTLWTEERLRKVIGAAAANGIAIELNNRYRLPGERAVRIAKELGCKFTYGSNNSSPTDLRRCEYGLEMTERCGLKWQDFWVPGAFGAKAIERKGAALSG